MPFRCLHARHAFTIQTSFSDKLKKRKKKRRGVISFAMTRCHACVGISEMVQGWTVQCNTEVKYGQIFGGRHGIFANRRFKNERLYIFCVFILYANNVYCSQPQCFQCIIRITCYFFCWHLEFSVWLPNWESFWCCVPWVEQTGVRGGDMPWVIFIVSCPQVTALRQKWFDRSRNLRNVTRRWNEPECTVQILVNVPYPVFRNIADYS